MTAWVSFFASLLSHVSHTQPINKRLPTALLYRYLAIVLLSIPSNSSPGDSLEKFRLSYTQRIRIETSDNVTHLSDSAESGLSYVRNRMSLLLQTQPTRNVAFIAKLTDEFRYYFVPESNPFTLDEIIFDLLYVRLDSLGRLPLGITLGRQDMAIGEGFVVRDGGPLDGSRAAYFNAVRLDWRVKEGVDVSLAYVYQPRTDHLLPVIHNQGRALVEQPEAALLLWGRGAIGRTEVLGYFVRKEARETDSQNNAAEIHCLGSRLHSRLADRLTWTAEAAIQFGRWHSLNQFALGGYTYLGYEPGKEAIARNISAGVLYLSGDDPATEDYEGWDPLFGRWPKWSESYIYTLVREGGVAYWSNIASVFGKTTIRLTTKVDLSADYHHLLAPQRADPELLFPGGCGRIRGSLYIVKLEYTVSERLRGHLLWEGFHPGNYYFAGADSFGWMRMEVFLSF